MEENHTLLYLGAGLAYGGLFLALIIAIVACTRPQYKDFRYGAFFLFGNLVATPMVGLGNVCFYYEFLSGGLAHALAIPTISIIIGVLFAYKFLDLRSKTLFWITNIPYILMVYTIILPIFNIIYIYKIYKPTETADLSSIAEG
ncbi:hypothetical protein [Cerasicoccus arenae]|uniref:Uncharacterized protein n=1 Tax=Cerasicoccus arenae TaxID=424488 RepID=A0A8J3DAZ7_9BACT|nr:hypothetical protein [Cerasicoccus arenae]MBK1858017.1 hypothetical protein [Cerasicoccus arenae]GHB97443.1 hypothetical protein GCM10007047_11560 [Cerasicoccus arenae]